MQSAGNYDDDDDDDDDDFYDEEGESKGPYGVARRRRKRVSKWTMPIVTKAKPTPHQLQEQRRIQRLQLLVQPSQLQQQQLPTTPNQPVIVKKQVLKKGNLLRMNEGFLREVWSEFMFILTADGEILYFDPKNPNFKKETIFLVKNSTVEATKRSFFPTPSTDFVIVAFEGKGSLPPTQVSVVLRANSEAEKDSWMEKLKKAIPHPDRDQSWDPNRKASTFVRLYCTCHYNCNFVI